MGSQVVREHRAGDELIHNPVVGDLDLTFDAMEPPASGKRLLLTIYTATPGSASHDSLQMPATWAATNDEAPT